MPTNPTRAGPQIEPEGRSTRRNPIAKATVNKPVMIKAADLHPAEVADGKRADGIAQEIIVGPRGALHDPRDAEQWTGD
jgi:hypothetical protein